MGSQRRASRKNNHVQASPPMPAAEHAATVAAKESPSRLLAAHATAMKVVHISVPTMQVTANTFQALGQRSGRCSRGSEAIAQASFPPSMNQPAPAPAAMMPAPTRSGIAKATHITRATGTDSAKPRNAPAIATSYRLGVGRDSGFATRRTDVPTSAESSDPKSTPTLTSSWRSWLSGNASSPMKRLIVKPMPHSREMP